MLPSTKREKEDLWRRGYLFALCIRGSKETAVRKKLLNLRWMKGSSSLVYRFEKKLRCCVEKERLCTDCRSQTSRFVSGLIYSASQRFFPATRRKPNGCRAIEVDQGKIVMRPGVYTQCACRPKGKKSVSVVRSVRFETLIARTICPRLLGVWLFATMFASNLENGILRSEKKYHVELTRPDSVLVCARKQVTLFLG